MKATITAAASTYVCALVAVVAVPRCRRLLILTQRGVESWEVCAPSTKLAPRAGRLPPVFLSPVRAGGFRESKFLGVSDLAQAVVASDAAAQQQQPTPHEQA